MFFRLKSEALDQIVESKPVPCKRGIGPPLAPGKRPRCAAGKGTTLIPGMPVEAYIRTEDRTPIAYLVKPLADYFNKALRE